MGKKIKWIIISIITIALIIVSTFFIINEKKINYDIEEIKEYNFFIFEQDDKYGVIDKNGKTIIEPTFEAIQIPNQEIPVFICIESYNKDTNEYKTLVYNEKKEVTFSEFQNVQAIPIYTNIDTTPYEKSVLSYKKDNKYGLVGTNGKKITEPIYDEIVSMNYKEGTFLVKQNDKQGVINMNGKVIIKPEFENVSSDNYYSQNKKVGFIVSQKTEEGYRYGYFNYRGKKVLDVQYTELERVTEIAEENDIYFIAFKDGQAGLIKNNKTILNFEYEDIQYNVLNDTFIVQRNGKQGVITREARTILYPEYDSILYGGLYLNCTKDAERMIFDLQGKKIETNIVNYSQTENPNYYIAIDENNVYKVVDSQGNQLIEDGYSYIEYIKDNYFIVARNQKYGVIDINGNFIIDLKYDSIFLLNNTNLIQTEIAATNTIELYNMKMEKKANLSNATIKQMKKNNFNSKDYILLVSDNEMKYYDIDGNEIQAQEIFKENKLFAKKIDGKWGFVDKNNELKVKNEYEMVTDFNNNGFAGIKKDGKWGIINKEGDIIQEPIYNLKWVNPEFLGKCYRLNAWYGDARYSSDIIEE